jgi:TP901 family phage tail tape measure protein
MATKYSIAISAIDQFSAPFKSYKKTSKKMVTQIRDQQAELKKLKSAQSDLAGFDKMARKLNQTSAALKEAKHYQSELKAQIDATERPSKRLTNAFEKATAKTTQLNAIYQTQKNRLNSLERSLSDAGFDAHKFATEQGRIERATKQTTTALKLQQARLKSVSDAHSRIESNRSKRAELRGQLVETAAMAYVAAQPIRAAINYESSMADVKKVVNFDDDKEAKKMGADILKMSTKLPMAADGIAQIVAAAGQSGVAKAELLDFAKSAAKMSTAFDISAESAGSTMAAWRAAMGLSQAQAVQLADATNYLSNNMNAQAKDIAGVLKRQGAVAMSAGLNSVQAASLSAALLSGGAGEEIASTAMKNITGAMMKGNNATSAQRAAWSQLGFDPNQLSKDMLTDAPKTMIRVFEAMKAVPSDQVNALVSTLFGEEVKGSVMPMLKNLDNLKNAFKMTADAAKYTGSMESEYQARSATTANNLQLLQNKLTRIGVSVGTVLLPPLNSLADGLGWVADGAAFLTEKFPGITKVATMAGLSLVSVAAGLTAFRYLKTLVMQPLNFLRLGKAKFSAMSSTTASTARNANLANRALRRMNATLSRMGRRGSIGGASAGADIGDFESDGRRRRGRRRRLRGRGKWGRLAALVGGGTALSMISASANAGDLAMAGADIVGTVGDLAHMLPLGGGGISRAGGSLLRGAGKLFRPLNFALNGAALTSAVFNGDSKQIGATAGDMAGGFGGSLAGAATGAAIGSVVPVIGTALGGLIGSIVGGFGGGELGHWAGGKLGELFGGDTDRIKPAQVSDMIAGNDRINGRADRLPSSSQVQKQLTHADNRQMVFSPSITIPPSSGNPEADQRLIDSLIERMKSELMPMMGGTDLAVRLDGSLSDRSGL